MSVALPSRHLLELQKHIVKSLYCDTLLGHIFLSIGALVGEICVGQHSESIIKGGQLSETIKTLDFYNPGCPLIPLVFVAKLKCVSKFMMEYHI